MIRIRRQGILLPLLGLAMVFAPAGPSRASIPADPKLPENGSEIRVIDPEEEEEDFVLLCAGVEAYGHELTTIGLLAGALKGAVPCVPGDFDGNGYFDFAIWGPRDPIDPSLPGMRRFKVLYFQEGRILKSQQIETPGCDHLWLFEANTELEEIDGDVPLNPNDGLLQIGEGKTIYYYVFDEEHGILKRIEWPGPGATGSVPRDQ